MLARPDEVDHEATGMAEVGDQVVVLQGLGHEEGGVESSHAMAAQRAPTIRSCDLRLPVIGHAPGTRWSTSIEALLEAMKKVPVEWNR